MTSCSTLNLDNMFMTPSEVEERVKNYENQLINYQSYDEVMINYNEIIQLPREPLNYRMQDLKKATNRRLEQIALEQFLPFYTDLEGNNNNIFNTAQDLIISKSIEEQDISLLLDWYDTYNSYNPVYRDSYSTPGSSVEYLVYEASKEIESQLLAEAIKLHDDGIIKDYFEKMPYEKLPQDSGDSKRFGGWGNAKKEILGAYREAILCEEEEKAYSIALESIESANQFLEDYPNSKYEEQVNTYILREEWFTSETYLNAVKDIPEEMMNSVLMLRQGVMNDLGWTFKGFFIDKAPMLECQIKKSGNDITVILKGTETKFTFTINMYYSPDYGGMMYIDSMKYSEGLFTREVYTTFPDKMSNFLALTTIYI